MSSAIVSGIRKGCAGMEHSLEQTLQSIRAALEESMPETLAAAVADIHPADLAEVYEVLNDEERSQLVFLLPAQVTAAMIVELDEAELSEAVEDLDAEALTEIVTGMAPDDAADVLGELTEEQREGILDQILEEQSEQIEKLLEYDEESAGGIMTPDLVVMDENATVGEAVEEIRRASEGATVHYLYTCSPDGKLVGVVSLRSLVEHRHVTLLADISERDPVSVKVNDDQEYVANQIRKYDIMAIPVVDESGVLVGQVTYDDVMDVAEEEAAEDLYYMAGTNASELEETSAAHAALVRLRWLLACMIGAATSGAIMALCNRSFASESIYEAMVIFVPMMGAMGGNSGIQISTILVRSLATGDLASTRVRKAIARELPITLIMAPVCGVVASLITAIGVPLLKHFDHISQSVSVVRLSLSSGVGMIAAIATASVLGMSLPYLFRRIGVDPAIASGPIVTTTNDIVSVTVFFMVGMLLMN